MKTKYEKYLSLFLLFVAIHSILVGIALIVVTNEVRILFGFLPSPEQFFQTQGGVFHIVMAIAYAMAAYDQKKYATLIQFIIIVKFFASAFLFSYFIIESSNLLILLSGIGDLLMAVIILILYKKSAKIVIDTGVK